MGCEVLLTIPTSPLFRMIVKIPKIGQGFFRSRKPFQVLSLPPFRKIGVRLTHFKPPAAQAAPGEQSGMGWTEPCLAGSPPWQHPASSPSTSPRIPNSLSSCDGESPSIGQHLSMNLPGYPICNQRSKPIPFAFFLGVGSLQNRLSLC